MSLTKDESNKAMELMGSLTSIGLSPDRAALMVRSALDEDRALAAEERQRSDRAAEHFFMASRRGQLHTHEDRLAMFAADQPLTREDARHAREMDARDQEERDARAARFEAMVFQRMASGEQLHDPLHAARIWAAMSDIGDRIASGRPSPTSDEIAEAKVEDKLAQYRARQERPATASEVGALADKVNRHTITGIHRTVIEAKKSR